MEAIDVQETNIASDREKNENVRKVKVNYGYGMEVLKGVYLMKKRILPLVVSFMLILGLPGALCSCGKVDESSRFSLGIVMGEQTDAAYIKNVENILEEKTEQLNAILEEEEQPYTIELEVLSEPGEEERASVFAQYDMLCSMSFDFTLEEMDSYFVDLKGELENGALKPLYESMPQGYWQTLLVNEHIYNTVRYQPPIRTSLRLYEKEQDRDFPGLESLGIEAPEGMSGKTLEEWSPFFEEVSEANEGKPFMVLPLSDMRWTGWQDHFQMVGPYLGISYGNPELGVQCIFESEECEEIFAEWKGLVEKGYVHCYTLPEYEERFGETESNNKKYITQGCFYGAEEEELYEGIQLYPLKDTGYAYPQWMERYFSGERDMYQLLVLKSSEKLEVVYQFLNALASDVELAVKVQEGLKDEGGLPLCYLSPYAGAKDNGGGMYFTDEPVEENIRKQRESYERLSEVPVPGFVLNEEPVAETIDTLLAECMVKEGLKVNPFIELESTISSWEHYEEYIESFVDQLYENGLQEIKEEVERQLEAYQP